MTFANIFICIGGGCWWLLLFTLHFSLNSEHRLLTLHPYYYNAMQSVTHGGPCTCTPICINTLHSEQHLLLRINQPRRKEGQKEGKSILMPLLYFSQYELHSYVALPILFLPWFWNYFSIKVQRTVIHRGEKSDQQRFYFIEGCSTGFHILKSCL